MKDKVVKNLVSILIPVFNVEKYLPDLFLSIEKQKYPDVEVIFVNDGSTDNSLSLLIDFCKKNKYAKVITQKNSGLASARNTALKAAVGEFLYIVDSDDFMNIYSIEKMVKLQRLTNADLITSNFKRISDKNSFSNIKQKESPNAKIKIINDNDSICSQYLIKFKSCFTRTVWNKLLKMEIVKTLDNFPNVWDEKIIIGEDNYFLSKYLLKCKKAVCIKNNLYFYRVRASSISHNKFNPQYYQIMKSSQNFLRLNDPQHKNTLHIAKALQCDFAFWLLNKMYTTSYVDVKMAKWLYSEYKKYFYFFKKYFNWPIIAVWFRDIHTKYIYKKILKRGK